jgi:two-component system sensor histidine kinase RegB
MDRLVPFEWVVRLRWIAAGAQLVVFLVAWATIAPWVPLPAMLGVLVVGMVSNAFLAVVYRARRPPEWVLVAVLVLDAVLLTALLAMTGGASNPFAPLYLLLVGLAAMVLRPRWTWALVAMTAACYGALFLLPDPHAHHAGSMSAHLAGMWVAFALGAPFLAFAITRIRSELALARQVQERAVRLASLATLAAGAAHELASPLSTIKVVARELERLDDASVAADGALLQREVDRCRDILSQLSADAGAGMGESPQTLSLRELVQGALGDREVVLEGDLEAEARLPVRLVRQALRRLLDNAFAASDQVALRVHREGEWLLLSVTDRGPGMTPEVLARAGEPFFTTRAPGEGMGLGLFFARSVSEHLGGTLEITSAQGSGTRATLRIPRLEDVA